MIFNNTVALLSPQIPQNTGNIARICAVTESNLHLVGTLGFSLDDKYMRRAGLDYWEHATIKYFEDQDDYVAHLLKQSHRTFLLSTKGSIFYTDVDYSQENISLVFGNEGLGTPPHIMDMFKMRGAVVRIPMHENRRSLNLAVSVGIALYEVLRQQQFAKLI